MIVLVINNGSTSFRFSVFDMKNNQVLAKGGAENIGTNSSYFKYKKYDCNEEREKRNINNCEEAFDVMCDYIFNFNNGVLNSIDDIDIIGHRVVHGGEKYTKATIINDEVLGDIENMTPLVPIHNKSVVESISLCKNNFRNIKNVAVFDTAFHSTIPMENYMYAIPKDLYEKYKIRKYGFHGISYCYVLNRYSQLINKPKNNINTIACHLGGGCSICSIKNGESFDTTMGYTPLSGLIMASRSGDVDPAIVPQIMNAYNITVDEAIKVLNKESGYLSICNEKDAKKNSGQKFTR